MKNSRNYRLYGIAGIVLAAMMILTFILDFTIIATSGAPEIDLNNVGPDLVRAGDNLIWHIESLLYLFQIVPFSGFALGIYWTLKSDQDGGLPALGLLTTGLFWVFHTLHNAAIVTTIYSLAPDYVPGTLQGQLIEAIAHGLLATGNTFFRPGGGVGTLLLVVGMIAMGQVILRTSHFPRWTGYAAMATALFSLVAYLQYVAESFFYLALVSWIIYIVWITVVSLRLTRYHTPVTS